MNETNAFPAYFETPLDRTLFQSAETLIQPPSGAALPPLAAGRFRYVLAANDLLVQARTPCVEASVLLAPLPAGLPYGVAREGVRLVHGPVPDDLRHELKGRAVAACPLEWSAYVLHDG